MNEASEAEVVRWYTRARRFPQLVGRFSDGTRIPGGPYTVTQVVAFFAIIAVAKMTTGIWTRFGAIGNVVVLVVVLVGVVWGLGRVPFAGRNPVAVVTGLGRVLGAPRTGRIAGTAIRISRPQRVSHRLVLALPASGPAAAPPATAAGPLPTSPALTAPVPTAPAPREVALTGIQALLASHPTERNNR